MENHPWNVTALRFDLLSELASWALPLAPPRLELVGQLEFELYRHVMDAACRTLDLLLGALVKSAGPKALVALVSDYGLLVGDSRPARSPRDLSGADSWRCPEGILVLSGPNCRPDEILFGAQLLDVAPTLLAALGLPLLPGFEGRVLAEAFTAALPPADEPTSAPRPEQTPARPDLPSDPSDEMIDQHWNRARALLDGRQVAAALELLEKLHRAPA